MKWRGEEREAKLDGATPVKNSGRGAAKGDAKWHEFLIDYKHNTKSFTINKKKWQKHAKDAWNDDHREPLYSVVLDDEVKVAVIDWHYLSDMLSKIRSCENLVDSKQSEIDHLMGELNLLESEIRILGKQAESYGY